LVSRPLKNRWVLVALLAAGQFVCLAAAFLLFAHGVQRAVVATVSERLLDATQDFADGAGRLVEQLDVDDVTPGSDGWMMLRDAVTGADRPDGGFLTVVRVADGRLLCHPHVGPMARLAKADVTDLPFEPRGGAPQLVAPETARGRLTVGDQAFLVATRPIPELGIQIVAHQPETVMRETVGAFMDRIRGIGLVATVAVSVLLALLAVIVVMLYESRLAARNARLRAMVADGSRSKLQSRSAVILGLAKLAESRDDETGQHLDRIRRYVRILAEKLLETHPEVDRDFVEMVVETSALHDIGKVGIPDGVLLKDGGLTEEQRTIINKHPLIGGDTLLAVKRRWGDDEFLVTACEVVFAHHERWDGTGYPFGLSGDIIPLAARIVAVADVYDALTSPRVYKPEVPHEEARGIIAAGRGTQFDPDIVDAFLATEADFARVQQSVEGGSGVWR
jgi:HD-GYP domain-containing protein (c-di-GMP phosphodiesterase class II)